MPLRNRVTPFNALEAVSARGALMGNRGILHDADRKVGASTWKHKRWVACVLSFKDRRRVPMSPGRYTELFFLDEAVSLAAGHRPCKECRRADYLAYASAWREANAIDPAAPLSADDIDMALHASRVATGRRAQSLFSSTLALLPEGTFVSCSDAPGEAWLVWGDALHRWTHDGYDSTRRCHGDATVDVLTPRRTVEVLRAGYVARVHASAGQRRGIDEVTSQSAGAPSRAS